MNELVFVLVSFAGLIIAGAVLLILFGYLTECDLIDDLSKLMKWTVKRIRKRSWEE